MDKIDLHSEQADAVLADMAQVFSVHGEQLTEFAVARKGGSMFNRAAYYTRPGVKTLRDFAASEQNVAFLCDIHKAAIAPPHGSLQARQTKNEHLKLKRVISFDLDFKDLSDEYPSWSRKSRREFAWETARTLKLQLDKMNLPLWLLVFSGGGLHLHFKLAKPLEIPDPKAYRERYKQWCATLEAALGDYIRFDRACCNTARLMRLPFSTNHKDAKSPVPTEVWHWGQDADASRFFHGIQGQSYTGGQGVSFEEVLRRFGYQKFATLETKGEEVVCSSPFSQDSTPSFYYNTAKRVFYDFSTSQGGSLYQLIQRLSRENPQVMVNDLKRQAQPMYSGIPTGYEVDKQGLWWLQDRGPDEDPIRHRLSDPVQVVALTRDFESQAWGRVLEFCDPDGMKKQWTMPVTMLAGDGQELRSELLSRGLRLSMKKALRAPLLDYLMTAEPPRRLHGVDKVGWHADTYVLPNNSYCKGAEVDSVRLQTTADTRAYTPHEDLDSWKKKVATPCKGHSRLMFALATAFAPPALKLLGAENGGVHFVGASSIGKTLALKVAASVWGGQQHTSLVRKWRSTVNGLEHLAESSNDGLLILDELAEVSPKAAGQAAYMLANGSGKQRLNKHGQARRCASWRTLFLSSGEIGLAEHLREQGETVRGGQHIRLVDIEADAGKGHGIFDHLPGGIGASALARQLEEGAASCGGSAIRAYLEVLTGDPTVPALFEKYQAEFLDAVGYAQLSRQSQRVAKRFALIAASGCYAALHNLLPWEPEESASAVRECFMSWLQAQPPEQDFETEQALERVRGFLETHAYSHFPFLTTLQQDPQFNGRCLGYRTHNAAGLVEWVVFSSTFKQEICAGLCAKRVLKVLRAKGLFASPKHTSAKSVRCPGMGVVRAYHFAHTLLTDAIQVEENIPNV